MSRVQKRGSKLVNFEGYLQIKLQMKDFKNHFFLLLGLVLNDFQHKIQCTIFFVGTPKFRQCVTGAGCGGAPHNGWHISLLHCTCPTLYTEPGESLLMPAAQCTFTSCWWYAIVNFTSLLVLNLIQGTREWFSPYSLKPEGGTQYCGLDNSKKINQLIYSSYFVQYF